MNHYTIASIICAYAVLLTGCKDNAPVSASGATSFWASTGEVQPFYEAIDLHYWADASDFPVAAVVSVLRGKEVRALPHTSRSEDGEVKEISLTTHEGRMSIPLYEKDLIKRNEVPVYCSFDGQRVTKITLSLEEFKSLEVMSKDKLYQSALTLITTKTAEQAGSSNGG
jgi:hypothetical protein